MNNSPIRWHCQTNPALRNSGDNIEDHQARVADMCSSLADSIGHSLHDSDLIRAALHHDEAERVLGDMPAPAKERFLALAAAYAEAEAQVLTEMGLIWTLTCKEADMLHLCDKLDAYTWAMSCGVTGPEWIEARFKMLKKAQQLDAVEWLRERIDNGPPM